MRTRLLAAALVSVPALTLAGPGPHHAAAGKPAVAAPVSARAFGGSGTPVAVVKVPMMAPSSAGVPVAKVGDEIIRMDELVSALAKSHQEAGMAKGSALGAVLDRLIDTRLVVGEAETMGLDELPEISKVIEEYETRALGNVMKDQVVRDVKPDSLAVEAVYREMSRAWKARSLHFQNAEDAAAARALLQSGRPYEEVAAKYVGEKKATDDGKAEVLPPEKLLPEIAAALSALKPGEVTAPIQVQDGFTLVKLEEIVYPEDPQKKAALEADSLEAEQQKALRAFNEKLVNKHTVFDRKLLARVNFEGRNPSFAALAKDKRPLVKIHGEKPITVADLAQAIRLKFFHGMDAPIRDKKVNELKQPLLQDMLARRLYLKEAREQRLHESDAYRLEVAEFRSALLFGKFTEKVIAPEVRLTEGDATTYYEKHKAEFTFPSFYQLDTLTFRDSKAAKSALDKLKAGTDFKWLRANADGVVPAEDSSLMLPSLPLSTTMLAKELLDALDGAGAGEYRMFKDGQHHIIHVVGYTPPRVQEYSETREVIAKKLYAQELTKKVKEYAAKLRKAHEVTVYITDIGS